MEKKNKKTKWTKKRHAFITALAYVVLYPIIKLKYHIKFKKFKERKGRQFFVISNHQTSFDQFFIAILFKGPVYYIASEDLFSKGFISKLLKFAVAPIPIKKQTNDVGAVLNCIKVAKEGGTIALFPEGNRTFSGKTEYFKSSIVSLTKMLKLPLAIMHIEGGYGIEPRWARSTRKGKMTAYVKRVVEYEEYSKLSNDELFELIKSELDVNEAKVDTTFTGKNLANYLERVMYVCPECGLSTFESKKDIITCKKCGKGMKYLPTKELEPVNCSWPFKFVNDWYEYQNDFIRHLDLSLYDNKVMYQDKAQFMEVIPYKNKKMISKEADVLIYNDRYEIVTSKETIVLDFDNISVVTILGRNKVNIYYQDKLYQIKGDVRMNAFKYMHIYYHKKNVEKGVIENEFLGI